MAQDSTPPGSTLRQPDAVEQREVLRQWRQLESGMHSPRGPRPDTPENPVAHKLLDAAGDAIGKGEVRQGVAILKLVVKEYPLSPEAALARRAIDQLRKQAGHGR